MLKPEDVVIVFTVDNTVTSRLGALYTDKGFDVVFLDESAQGKFTLDGRTTPPVLVISAPGQVKPGDSANDVLANWAGVKSSWADMEETINQTLKDYKVDF